MQLGFLGFVSMQSGLKAASIAGESLTERVILDGCNLEVYSRPMVPRIFNNLPAVAALFRGWRTITKRLQGAAVIETSRDETRANPPLPASSRHLPSL